MAAVYKTHTSNRISWDDVLAAVIQARIGHGGASVERFTCRCRELAGLLPGGAEWTDRLGRELVPQAGLRSDYRVWR
jgi:hypothetical protein